MSGSNALEDRAKYYLKNGVLSIVGYIFNKAISFLLIPILTKMMSTADYGVVNTYLAWVSILSYIIGLALEYSIRTAYTDYKDKYETYVSSVYLLSLLAFVSIGIAVFVLNAFVFHQASDLICAICVVHAYVLALVNYISIKYTMLEKIGKKVAILLFPNLIAAILSIVLIVYIEENKYMGRIWGCIIVFVPVGIGVLTTQFKKSSAHINKDVWKYALNISVPMVFHGLGYVVLSSSDRIIINHFLGSESTGIYSLVYSFIQVILAIVAAIESVWIPWFTKQMEKNNVNILNKIGALYALIISILVSGLILVSPELIVIISTSDYADGKEIILPLLLSGYVIFMYSFSIHIEIFYKKTKRIAIYTSIAAIINIVMDWFLVPIYGISAAAYVTLASYFILFGLHYYSSFRLERRVFPFSIHIVPALIIIVVSALSIMFGEYTYVRWGLGIVLGVLSLIGFIYLYKTKIKS